MPSSPEANRLIIAGLAAEVKSLLKARERATVGGHSDVVSLGPRSLPRSEGSIHPWTAGRPLICHLKSSWHKHGVGYDVPRGNAGGEPTV